MLCAHSILQVGETIHPRKGTETGAIVVLTTDYNVKQFIPARGRKRRE